MLQGSEAQTFAEATACVAQLAPEDVLWVAQRAHDQLGRTYAACVLDFHRGVDADLLGQCYGLVLGGGALIVRVGDGAAAYPQLAAWGYDVAQVGQRMPNRVLRELREVASTPHTLPPPTFIPRATPEQAHVVDAVIEAVRAGEHVVLTSDRGRGKSATLGLAARDFAGRVAVTAASRDAVLEVLRFGGALDFVAVPALLAQCDFDVVIVDEAAQLPVATLQQLVEQNADTRFVFATTTHGYEGTGRGFSLRFVRWLRDHAHASSVGTRELTLSQPIRWCGEGDARDRVEGAVFRALLLDAEPLDLAPPEPQQTPVRPRHIPREELADNEPLLRQIFGLLVQAHYRTTPADLHRLLDAPNLAVHASFMGDAVVAVNLIAHEGGLSEDAAEQLASGAMRVVGHALPETFAAHLSCTQPATWTMLRSVRIVTHPDMRGRGLATQLIEHIHDSYTPELFGTLFAVQPDVIRFRRALGYEAIRLSASRSARTGVPSVAMVRAMTPRARAVVEQLRGEYARDLPTQLALLRAEGALQHDVEAALQLGLRPSAPLSPESAAQIVRAYAFGPRTFESAAVAITQWVTPRLRELPSDLQALVRVRALQQQSWQAAVEASGIASVPAAMRAMRRAMRTLVENSGSVI